VSQTKLQSAVETAASTAVGFAISWAATLVVLPWFGHQPSVADGFGITVAFTVLSLVRGYALRRFFNWLHRPVPPLSPEAQPGSAGTIEEHDDENLGFRRQ
jgi:hypothetical protein